VEPANSAKPLYQQRESPSLTEKHWGWLRSRHRPFRPQDNTLALHHCDKRAAAHRLECRLPIASLNLLPQARSTQPSRNDLIDKDFRQGILILRRQQVLDRARRQFRVRLIGWSKDDKRGRGPLIYPPSPPPSPQLRAWCGQQSEWRYQ